MAVSSYLQQRLTSLPEKPGVYLLKGDGGAVLYVGKAANLRERVRSYFTPPSTLDAKTQKLAARVQDIDLVLTTSEHEAFILENNLIKRHRPRYNIRLKDDKTYPYIKVTLNEEWPRVLLTRRFEDDGGRYFGPFASAGSVRTTLELLKTLFKYCNVKHVITGRKPRPCFDYHLNRCVGACAGKISNEEYRKLINQVILFLEGKQEKVIRELRKKMEQAAMAEEFEKAAAIRDQLMAIEKVSQGLKMAFAPRGDEDVVALARERDEACVQVFFIRSARLIGKEHYVLEGTQDEATEKIIASFIQQFYGSAPYVPPRILLQIDPEDRAELASWLAEKRGRSVRIEAPQRGLKKKLVDMVAENAVQSLEQIKIKRLAESGKTAVALKELQDTLRLPRLPRRIECYDISDIRGTSAVGSMAVFEEGRPKNAAYRRFKIKTVEGSDDYAMMREVLRRRFKRAAELDAGSWAVLPDLVLIDGGKGHLSVALEVMRDLDLPLPVAALAKENEEVFLPAREQSIILPRTSPALYLVQRIRDEAHRFALSYHLILRKKKTFTSALEVPGIGPKRRKALLQKFGSLQAIRQASVEDLAAIPGMNKAAAQKVKENV